MQELVMLSGYASPGGGNNAITMHTEYFLDDDWLEEQFLHEGAHTSLDWASGGTVDEIGWTEAQAADCYEYISEYARDNFDREDVADL